MSYRTRGHIGLPDGRELTGTVDVVVQEAHPGWGGFVEVSAKEFGGRVGNSYVLHLTDGRSGNIIITGTPGKSFTDNCAFRGIGPLLELPKGAASSSE